MSELMLKSPSRTGAAHPLATRCVLTAITLASALACSASSNVPPLSPDQTEKPSPTVGTRKEPLPADIVERSALPLAAFNAEGELSPEEYAETLWQAQVVCFGETHSDARHHYAQLVALRTLSARARQEGAPLGVGFEMFQQPFQQPLTEFTAGRLDERAFIEQTEYEKRWGFDFALYRPLLDVARDAGLDVLALNAPRELSKQIGRQGLSSLSADQRAGLPELVLDDPEHRAYFDEAMGAHPMPEGGPKLDDMYAAQVLWDESMADASARWLERQPDSARLMVIAGAGHCHHSAIPERLSRRSPTRVLSVLPILASESAPPAPLLERYDLLVVLDDDSP